MLVKVIRQAKDEIKEEGPLSNMVLACLNTTLSFFDLVIKQMKKNERTHSLSDSELGHLVPLTVGHRDRPNENELRYIRKLMIVSGFLYSDASAAQEAERPASPAAAPPKEETWGSRSDSSREEEGINSKVVLIKQLPPLMSQRRNSYDHENL